MEVRRGNTAPVSAATRFATQVSPDPADRFLASASRPLAKKQRKDALYFARKAGVNLVWAKNATGTKPKPDAQRPVAQVYFYHPDHLGTATLLTDINGQPYQYFLNLPFGEEMAAQRAGGDFSSRYKFNGKELDEQTGYYYYGARYYDPVISRWLSVDPLAEKYPGFSPYNYTANNPVMLVDPDGKWLPKIDKDGRLIYIAEKGDSAWTLAKDAHISPAFANTLVVKQLGPNYIGDDGEVKSNVDPGDKVVVGYLPDYAGQNNSNTNNSGNSANTTNTSSTGSKIPDWALLITDMNAGAGIGTKQIDATFRIRRSGQISPKLYKSGWRGNQYVNTYSFRSIGKWLKGGASAINISLWLYKIRESYIKENGFGPETQRLVGRAIGSYIGAEQGAELFAAAGFFLGDGWGAIPAGMIGAGVGGEAGGEIGEDVVRYLQEHLGD